MAELKMALIEQIKLFRSLTGLDLCDSKIAVEHFIRAQGLIDDKITNMTELFHFARFCALFTSGTVEVDERCVRLALPKPLTDQELYDMIKP